MNKVNFFCRKYEPGYYLYENITKYKTLPSTETFFQHLNFCSNKSVDFSTGSLHRRTERI